MNNEISVKLENLIYQKYKSEFFKFEPEVRLDDDILSTLEYKK
jgi:hypothetical protein